MRVELVSYTKIADSYMGKLELEEAPNADDLIAFLARISSNKTLNSRFDNTEKLLNYCFKHGHWSIFDMIDVTFYIETSIAISKQILRHWSFRFQEVSRRYQPDGVKFEKIELRMQGKSNRQVGDEVVELHDHSVKELMDKSYELYNSLIERGIASETARMLLPQCTTTGLYMKGSVRSWMSFLNQRLSPHAQKEIRVLAVNVAKQLDNIIPKIAKSTDMWNNYGGAFM